MNEPYGYCPVCGAPGVTRERNRGGYDTCQSGHRYHSNHAVDKSKPYLVICRNQDAPHSYMLSEDEVKEKLKEDWNGFNFLDKVPDYESFPSESVFIFKGAVIIPEPVQSITEWKV